MSIQSFEAPKPKLKRKLEAEILEEEEYLARMMKIIKRDFFPRYKQSHEVDALFKPREDIDNLTLNQFIYKYRSEDNVSFGKLLKKADQDWREKNMWIFLAEKLHQESQADALESSDNNAQRCNNMISAARKRVLAVCEFKGMNDFFNLPQGMNKKDNFYDVQKVNYEGTRFEDSDMPFEFITQFQRKKIDDLMMQNLSTPDLLGYKNKEDQDKPYNLDKLRGDRSFETSTRSLQNINGYMLIRAPEDEDEEGRRLKNYYTMPGDNVEFEVNEKLNKIYQNKKKVLKKVTDQAVRKVLQDCTPKSRSYRSCSSSSYHSSTRGSSILNELLKIRKNPSILKGDKSSRGTPSVSFKRGPSSASQKSIDTNVSSQKK